MHEHSIFRNIKYIRFVQNFSRSNRERHFAINNWNIMAHTFMVKLANIVKYFTLSILNVSVMIKSLYFHV